MRAITFGGAAALPLLLGITAPAYASFLLRTRAASREAARVRELYRLDSQTEERASFRSESWNERAKSLGMTNSLYRNCFGRINS
jgi:hypothetical protein